MSVFARLLKVGSMADSLGAYIPAKIVQKTFGFGRYLLFVYLLSKTQLSLWGIGLSIFTVGAPLITLGSNHGLVRYTSFFEARGRLGLFYRRLRWRVVLLALAMTAAGFACSGPITRYFIPAEQVTQETYRQYLYVCWAALANALLLGLHYNIVSLIIGLRAYRLVGAVEVLFAAVLIALAGGMLQVSATAFAVLLAHFLALLVAMAAAMVGLHALLRQRPQADPKMPKPTAAVEAVTESEATSGLAHLNVSAGLADEGAGRGDFARVLFFGLAALPGFILWESAGKVSFWMVAKIRDMAEGGEFLVFLLFGQPIVFLADAAWAVVFTHVARRWETGERDTAMFVLQTAYKAIALVMMSLTIVLLASAPLWVKILPGKYRHALVLLPGLLMFFQVMIHLALLTILAKLHERPWVIALAGLFGVVANVALALWWIPAFDYGPRGAAVAAGVGMYAGSGVLTALYLGFARVRVGLATGMILIAPAILLLPVWAAGAIWALVLGLSVCTPLMFGHREKLILRASFLRLTATIRRAAP